MDQKAQTRMGITGFTLIELVIVVLIVVIIIALTFPRFQGAFKNFQFDNFLKEFVAAAKLGRERAVATGDYYQLELDLAKQRYGIIRLVSDGEVLSRENIGRWQRIPEDVRIEGEGQTLVFSPGGNTVKSILYVINTSGKSAAVRITSTGFIRIYTELL